VFQDVPGDAEQPQVILKGTPFLYDLQTQQLRFADLCSYAQKEAHTTHALLLGATSDPDSEPPQAAHCACHALGGLANPGMLLGRAWHQTIATASHNHDNHDSSAPEGRGADGVDAMA
jgi:hypothetical protein